MIIDSNNNINRRKSLASELKDTILITSQTTKYSKSESVDNKENCEPNFCGKNVMSPKHSRKPIIVSASKSSTNKKKASNKRKSLILDTPDVTVPVTVSKNVTFSLEESSEHKSKQHKKKMEGGDSEFSEELLFNSLLTPINDVESKQNEEVLEFKEASTSEVSSEDWLAGTSPTSLQKRKRKDGVEEEVLTPLQDKERKLESKEASISELSSEDWLSGTSPTLLKKRKRKDEVDEEEEEEEGDDANDGEWSPPNESEQEEKKKDIDSVSNSVVLTTKEIRKSPRLNAVPTTPTKRKRLIKTRDLTEDSDEVESESIDDIDNNDDNEIENASLNNYNNEKSNSSNKVWDNQQELVTYFRTSERSDVFISIYSKVFIYIIFYRSFFNPEVVKTIVDVVPPSIFKAPQHRENVVDFYAGLLKECSHILTAKDNVATIANDFFRYLINSKNTVLEKDFYDSMDGIGNENTII